VEKRKKNAAAGDGAGGGAAFSSAIFFKIHCVHMLCVTDFKTSVEYYSHPTFNFSPCPSVCVKLIIFTLSLSFVRHISSPPLSLQEINLYTIDP
jgi:hypothetical protein